MKRVHENGVQSAYKEKRVHENVVYRNVQPYVARKMIKFNCAVYSQCSLQILREVDEHVVFRSVAIWHVKFCQNI